jgi:hypothetical protein
MIYPNRHPWSLSKRGEVSGYSSYISTVRIITVLFLSFLDRAAATHRHATRVHSSTAPFVPSTAELPPSDFEVLKEKIASLIEPGKAVPSTTL